MENQQIIQNVKDQIIKAILEKIGSKQLQFGTDSTELFNSIPIDVPHDSSLLDVIIEIKVSKDGVSYKCDEDDGMGGMYDDEDFVEDLFEHFDFNELTISQLVLILENC